ncbi:MAG: MFS transporter [Candidatus Nanoarchaeia archaeon]
MFFHSLYSKNIFFIQSIFAIKELIFFHSVIYILFLQAYIESYTLISVLLTITLILTIVFEYITGVFTDIYGRANSIKLAQLSFIIVIILFLLSTSFIGFLAAVFFLALGGALSSGSVEALLYESLKKENKKSQYTSKLTIIQVLTTSFGVVTNFMAPLVFDINPKYPFIISLIFSIIGLILSFNLIETQQVTKQYSLKNTREDSKRIMKKNITLIFKDSLFLKITLFSVMFGAIIGSFAELFNQPLIFDQFDTLSYGIIFAAATVVQTFIVIFSSIIIEKLRNFFYLFLILLWSVCLFVIVYFQNLYLTIIFMGIIWSIGSFTYIFITKEIQELIQDDEIRTSTPSMLNLFKSSMIGITILVGGVLIDMYSLTFSLIVLNVIFLTISFIVAVSLFVQKQEN